MYMRPHCPRNKQNNTNYLIRPLLNRPHLQDIPIFVLSFGYIYWQIGEVIVCEQHPDTVSSVCPPPLSPVSDFVSLAICSHCAVLPDGRHSGRLGSVNCKGMWHSVLKLRMFLWIFRVCDGRLFYFYFVSHGIEWRKCFSTCMYKTLCSLWTTRVRRILRLKLLWIRTQVFSFGIATARL